MFLRSVYPDGHGEIKDSQAQTYEQRKSWATPGWYQPRSSCGCILQHHPSVLPSLPEHNHVHPCSGFTLKAITCQQIQTFPKGWYGRQDLWRSPQRHGSVEEGLLDTQNQAGFCHRRITEPLPCTLRKEKAFLYFTSWGTRCCRRAKGGTLYSGRCQRERRVLGRPPELAPYWLHPRLFEEKLGLSKLSASLLRLCVL